MTWRAGGRPRRRTLRTWRGGTRTWRADARAGGRAGYAGEVSLTLPRPVSTRASPAAGHRQVGLEIPGPSRQVVRW